jgi:hypothetical protein
MGVFMKSYFYRIFSLVLLAFAWITSPLVAMTDWSCDEKAIECPSPSEYSINLMWINRDLNEQQLFIHPSKDEASLNKNFLDPIFEWAFLHKDAVVNIWFDSTFISPQAIKNTETALEHRLVHLKEKPIAPILLRDIRTLHKVAIYPNVFSNKIPVYFRVDLARMIIALELLSTSTKPTYFVYADVDMKPLTPEEFFDAETIRKLKEYGFVMAKVPLAEPGTFENGFQIMSNINLNLLEAISFVIVDLNIARAMNALAGQFFDLKDHDPMKSLQEAVYASYGIMFKYFWSLDKKNTWKLQVMDNGKFRDYDKKADGLKPFGLRRSCFLRYGLRVKCTSITSFWGKIKSFFTDEMYMDYIPTKKVQLPPTEIKSYKDPIFDPLHPNYTAQSSQDPYSEEDPETW